MKVQKKFLLKGEAGDIVIIAGLEKANVADTICDLEVERTN
jgi:predicted membrane GTPase involved in stress response